MCDANKSATSATDIASLADFRRWFEQEVRRASPNRYWVVMPGEHGDYRVHAADDAETAAAILHGNPPKGGRRNDEAASAARPTGPASER